MNSKVLDISISRTNIVDQVAALLYATGVVNNRDNITNIQFGELFGASDTELVPLKVYINKEVEVELLETNGKGT
jgi:hypothetical protein